MGLSIRQIVPLSTFKKNTTECIETMRKAEKPLILTVNGKPSVVVQDAESYEEMTEHNEAMEKELKELKQAVVLRTVLEQRLQKFDESKESLTSNDIRNKISGKKK